MVIAGDTSSSNTTKKKKITQGRKKIEIKKIQDPNTRQVTFSKRRAGLFKKASELCILTGAQIAIFVNSPGGRIFTYGHPDADIILDRYLNNNDNEQYPREAMVPATSEFNQHYTEVSRELEVEIKKGKEMIPTNGDDGGSMWFEKDFTRMNVDELEEFLYAMMEMKKKVLTRVDELMMINKAPGFFGPNAVSVMEPSFKDVPTTMADVFANQTMNYNF